MKDEIGVIIGRFQVDDLSEGHRDLFDTVISKHTKVVALLGSTPSVIGDQHQPLPLAIRILMFREAYPNVICLPVSDHKFDEDWSKQIDYKLDELYPANPKRLYGARDSFIPYYSGVYPTVELESIHSPSGTEIRKAISEEEMSDRLFRRGIIFACYMGYNDPRMTIDILVFNTKENKFVFGRKKSDLPDTIRFFGGFVESGETLEDAAIRELEEESNIIVQESQVKYLGSFVPNDWRFRKSNRKVTSALFYVETDQMASPGDDIDSIICIPREEVSGKFVEEHGKMWEKIECLI